MEEKAIKLIQDTAVATTKIENIDYPAMVIPAGAEVKSLEGQQRHRNQYRGTMATSLINDFIKYVKKFEGDQCFIDPDNMSAKTYFDLGDIDLPGHAKHSATLTLKKSAPYNAVLSIDERKQSQKALAEWIEDWKHNLLALDSDGEEMDIKKAIASIRRVTIEAKQKQEHGTETFSANKSAMESIEAKSGNDKLPGWLIFTCEPYKDLGDFEFHLRISLVTGHEPVFIPRIARLEAKQEDIANKFRDILLDCFGDSVETYLGTFKA